jgi:hypothetical protein
LTRERKVTGIVSGNRAPHRSNIGDLLKSSRKRVKRDFRIVGLLTLSYATIEKAPVFCGLKLADFLHRCRSEGFVVMQKENQLIDAMDYMESVDYIAYTHFAAEASDSRIDGPTALSIASAQEAQQRERAAFTRDTGILLDRDGRPLHRSERV